MKITSTANPQIKALAQYKERKYRETQGHFLVEGLREVERALAAGFKAVTVIVSESADSETTSLANSIGTPLVLSQGPLQRLSSRENPAQVMALFATPSQSLANFVPSTDALITVAVGIEKPGNLGAILRSADAAGAGGLIAIGGVDLYSPQVIRNSTGVVFSLPTFAAREPEALSWLQEHRFNIVATTPHASKVYWETNLTGRTAIVLGPEHEGLNPAWLHAQSQIRIPMHGQADSLNVSVSAALLLFEALRQRQS
jgi:RNA methyltransferase, TrmH family